MLTLPELTPQQITALLNAPKKRRNRKAKSYGIGFDDTNTLIFLPKPTASQKGGFAGKVGTTRRSRKGRTYKAPNGTRYYDGLGQDIAYLP